MKISNPRRIRVASYLLLITFAIPLIPAFAQEPVPINAEAPVPIDAKATQFLSAAIAFGLAAIAAGWAVGRAGSAGLAGTAERPEMRTTAIIITALGEALAIYGIVIAIMILGQA